MLADVSDRRVSMASDRVAGVLIGQVRASPTTRASQCLARSDVP
jgi:hypothetical protein